MKRSNPPTTPSAPPPKYPFLVRKEPLRNFRPLTEFLLTIGFVIVVVAFVFIVSLAVDAGAWLIHRL